jgi:hypothetical protein
MGLRKIPGALPPFKQILLAPRAFKRVAEGLFPVLPLLFLTSVVAQPVSQAPKATAQNASATPTTPPSQASAESAPPTRPPNPPANTTPGSSQAPTPPVPATFTPNPLTTTAAPGPVNPPPSVLPAATRPAPKPLISSHGPLPAAIIPGLEMRVGFSSLSRVSSSNDRVLYKGLNTSVTMQYTDRIGGTLQAGYLRAPNVFHTGQSNSLLTYLLGPVFYPYRGDGLVTSLDALGGGARVAGAIALTATPGQYLKGTVDHPAWALGGGVEKWFFSDSLALRVDIDALHTTFFNSVAKVHGEYDLRATWGISYNFGPRRRGGKFRDMAGQPIE